MSDQFVAEIRIGGFNFAPKGWATCDGQLLPISQNTALFSLLGTNYGGDGKSTYQLPNFQGCAPMHPGQGPGLTDRLVGETGGSQTVTLLQSEIPAHNHLVRSGALADTEALSPAGTSPGGAPTRPYAAAADGSTTLSPVAITMAGGGGPHNNMPPYLVMNFIIALQGIFPARS